MTTPDEHNIDHAELDKAWHGWGSPVGLGIALLSLALSVALLIAAVSLVL